METRGRYGRIILELSLVPGSSLCGSFLVLFFWLPELSIFAAPYLNHEFQPHLWSQQWQHSNLHWNLWYLKESKFLFLCFYSQAFHHSNRKPLAYFSIGKCHQGMYEMKSRVRHSRLISWHQGVCQGGKMIKSTRLWWDGQLYPLCGWDTFGKLQEGAPGELITDWVVVEIVSGTHSWKDKWRRNCRKRQRTCFQNRYWSFSKTLAVS